MRTLSQFTESVDKFSKIKANENSLNYLSVEDLDKYVDAAGKFLSNDTKDIIQYLKVNNKTYLSDLGNDNDENIIVGFYNAGKPVNKEKAELWETIKRVAKTGRILEIPTLLNKENFDKIVNGTVPPDRVILDMDSERGRNEIVKLYEPLMHKICRQWLGKSTLEYDDLYSNAQMGMIWAMDNYGVKKAKRKSNPDEPDVDEIKQTTNQTFGQYASYMILYSIIAAIRNESHLVAIPINKQQEEKKRTGKNIKNRSISGDKKVGINNSDEGNKTIFDFIEDGDSASRSIDNEDIKNLWQEIWDELDKVFDKKIMQAFYSFHGLNGYDQLKNKEIAQKYNVSNSLITYYCVKVEKYIQSNKQIMNKLKEIYELMNECLSVDDTRNNILSEPLHINI